MTSAARKQQQRVQEGAKPLGPVCVQLALGGIESAFWSGLRNWMQLAIVVSFPAYATLPSGLFAYLLPHGALSLLQALIQDTATEEDLRRVDEHPEVLLDAPPLSSP
mgnify:CR=1 FL=1